MSFTLVPTLTQSHIGLHDRPISRELYTWTGQTVFTRNIRSLLGSGESDLLVKELQRLKWDVVGLAELHWKDQGVLDLDDGCKIIFSGASKQGQAGVGFLLSDTAYRSVISFDPFSDRIISVRCRGQGPNITIFQVYAPTFFLLGWSSRRLLCYLTKQDRRSPKTRY